MSDQSIEFAGHEFDASERKRIRKWLKIVSGNGEAGLVNKVDDQQKQLEAIKKLSWVIIGGIGALILQGVIQFRLPQAPPTYMQQQQQQAGEEQPHKEIFTTEELADQLEVNADTVRRREAEGKLAGYVKAGRNTWRRVHEPPAN